MELELKYKVSKDYEDILKDAGFIFMGNKHQIDECFLIHEILNDKSTYLRLRKDLLGNTFSCDYHERVSRISTKETEIKISSDEDFDKMKYILESLGYSVKCTVEKDRKVYRREDVEVVCDNIKGLGNFIEIEIQGDETDESFSKLELIAKELQLDKEVLIDNGYPELCLEANIGT